MLSCRAIHGAATSAVLVLLCVEAACSQAPRPDRDIRPGTAEPRAAQKPLAKDAKILFLHHSTGECIWNGGVEAWFDAYNRAHDTKYKISRQAFPKSEPYGWANYPYDYWNIWVNHAGPKPFKAEPTLEILTPEYGVIVLKHCFPVSNVEEDTGRAEAASDEKRVENYMLQYAALRRKLREFPLTRFILWTGAAQVKNDTDEAQARRAKAFFDWVKGTWDEAGDNIYLWDFRALETEGGLYLKPANAAGDGHPNEEFSKKVAPLFCQRVIDVIAGRGDLGDIAGRKTGETENAKAQVMPSVAETAPQTRQSALVPSSALDADNTWLFDNAEDPNRKGLWPDAARYVQIDKGQAIGVDFRAGKEEDWGEYGRQRIVATTAPPKDWDIAKYRYMAMRVRADRKMTINVTLVTEGDRADDSSFGFTAYVELLAGKWTQVVLDLTKLELNAEGERAYAAAGKPMRPKELTCLRLVTAQKNANAAVAIDDIAFHVTLPDSIAERAPER